MTKIDKPNLQKLKLLTQETEISVSTHLYQNSWLELVRNVSSAMCKTLSNTLPALPSVNRHLNTVFTYPESFKY